MMLTTTGLPLLLNSTVALDSEFILIGFPGLEQWQKWFSLPLVFFLLLAMVANITLIITIYREHTLHQPMYYFLCNLGIIDLSLSIIITPKLLTILWFDAHSISMAECFTQMFFGHLLFLTESGTLAAMASDRYIAIWSPLRYTSILNNRLVLKIIVIISGRAFLCSLPVPFLAAQLHYCSDHIIKHSYCNNIAVTKLSCDDISLNSIYQMTVVNLMLGGDLLFIFLSYCLILWTVLKLHVERAFAKALSTCSSHLIIILIFYSIIIVVAITHHTENEFMTSIAIVLNVFLVIVPPAMNPIIYGVRNTDINLGLKKHLSNRCCG
ncbi:olfactory receptor 56A4-like [Pleurodeles waltl]|uniref:olfactory receptor 56A4-like n=1 Tax=Pleurodeles waltl TaxID=8319 RepID=UPI0037098A20